VGSWADACTLGEVSPQANKASPASLMFVAATQSAFAEKPHATQMNCELSPESVRLLSGELLKGCIQLRFTTPVAPHRQVLLEQCPVVAFLFRCLLGRRTTRGTQTLH
jgi:hypothetical protein